MPIMDPNFTSPTGARVMPAPKPANDPHEEALRAELGCKPGESVTAAIFRRHDPFYGSGLGDTDRTVIAQEASKAKDAEIARLTGRVALLEGLLAEWARTFPDLHDEHDQHTRGHYYTSNCAGCRAEWEMLKEADQIEPYKIMAEIVE